MNLSSKLASMVAVAATMTIATVSTAGSKAAAQDLIPTLVPASPAVTISVPVVETPSTTAAAAASDDAQATPATLNSLVNAQAREGEMSSDMKCLAGAIYFEAKGETLAGQLAVGRVIVARAKSGRFPASYCGVVFQPSQFSFLRGRAMPAIRKDARGWREAVAIAQISDAGSWKSQSEGALYFHAARVSPHWRMTRLARVDDHDFYR
jgi:N-acetylmuramoyl-L-alanine amidase